MVWYSHHFKNFPHFIVIHTFKGFSVVNDAEIEAFFFFLFPCFFYLLDGSDGKEFVCSVGDLGLIPQLGRFPGEGNGNLLQCSCLETPVDRGAWWLQSMEAERVTHD